MKASDLKEKYAEAFAELGIEMQIRCARKEEREEYVRSLRFVSSFVTSPIDGGTGIVDGDGVTPRGIEDAGRKASVFFNDLAVGRALWRGLEGYVEGSLFVFLNGTETALKKRGPLPDCGGALWYENAARRLACLLEVRDRNLCAIEKMLLLRKDIKKLRENILDGPPSHAGTAIGMPRERHTDMTSAVGAWLSSQCLRIPDYRRFPGVLPLHSAEMDKKIAGGLMAVRDKPEELLTAKDLHPAIDGLSTFVLRHRETAAGLTVQIKAIQMGFLEETGAPRAALKIVRDGEGMEDAAIFMTENAFSAAGESALEIFRREASVYSDICENDVLTLILESEGVKVTCAASEMRGVIEGELEERSCKAIREGYAPGMGG